MTMTPWTSMARAGRAGAMLSWRHAAIALVAFGTVVHGAQAGEARVAVASNFLKPMQALAADFTAATGHEAVLSAGSTGKLYAQVVAGAPFDVLLAADEATPRRLVREGHAVAGSQFTYAVGRLVLWSPDPALVDADGAVLGTDRYRRLAIASPRLAPYGAAAHDVLEARGVLDFVSSRLATGQNVAQAWQFVVTGNAELGFVALAQVLGPGRPPGGSMWRVPPGLHRALRQDAVLLAGGMGNEAARALLAFLRTPAARERIRSFGYESGDGAAEGPSR